MAEYRNAVDIDIWPVSKLMDAVSGSPVGNNKVTIPEYQRRLVWNQGTRKALIQSIKRGYPFGSILLYEDISRGHLAGDGKRYYGLIDGLQRTQALKSYVEYQNGYFTRADLEDEFVDTVAMHMGKETDEHKDRIRQTIVDWVKGVKSYEARDGWRTDSLVEALIKEVLKYSAESSLYRDLYFELNRNQAFSACLGGFLDAVSGEVKLVLDAKIPVLIYAGAPSELPSIFELLNSKGTTLSKYEIFAAQWIDVRQRIANPEVIDAIWKKNESLEEEGFTLDVSEEAPDEASRRKRKYTLFDYLFGLGQVLCDQFPLLFKPAKEDRPSSVGFNLMTASVGLHVSDMADLPQEVVGLDLTTLEGCILESTGFVNRLLEPLLSAKQPGRQKSPIYHSELMVVSMIATAFQVRFGTKDLSDNPNWRADRSKLKLHLLMYYLHDILRDDWRGSGDSKLYDTVRTMRYLENPPPSKKRWGQVLDDWYWATQFDHVHSKSTRRHIRDSLPEYLLLKYIYVHRMVNIKTYHVEHIVPVANLQAHMGENDEWPMNTIGNLALLERAGEFKHNVQTYDNMLQNQRQRGDITDAEQDALLDQYARQLLCPPELLPQAISKKSFEDFLMRRWDLLKSEFIKVWREYIPEDPQN